MRRTSSALTFAYVIFDTDGTLVDTLELIVASYNYAVAELLGKKFGTAEVSGLFGPTMEKILAKIVPSKYLKAAVARYHEYYQLHFRDHARIYPGIHELLSALHRTGKKLAVFTGAGEQAAKVTLEQAGLSGFFSTVVTGDDVSQPKPDPHGLILAMRAIGASADQTIYIGDTREDVEASRSAGIRSAVALWGSGDSSRLRALKSDFIFRDPSEALEVLLND